jgi:hypothetical protein
MTILANIYTFILGSAVIGCITGGQNCAVLMTQGKLRESALFLNNTFTDSPIQSQDMTLDEDFDETMDE